MKYIDLVLDFYYNNRIFTWVKAKVYGLDADNSIRSNHVKRLSSMHCSGGISADHKILSYSTVGLDLTELQEFRL